MRAVLFRPCLSASAHNLWRERNNIRHGNHLQTEEKIIQKINWEVRMRIMSSGRFLRNRDNEELYNSWGLPDSMFGGRWDLLWLGGGVFWLICLIWCCSDSVRVAACAEYFLVLIFGCADVAMTVCELQPFASAEFWLLSYRSLRCSQIQCGLL